MITVYHNPKCGKSRECIAFLEASNKTFEIVKYLDAPISKEKLTELIYKLGIPAIDLIRTKEPLWIKNYKEKKLSNEDVISAILNHPILMERPVVMFKNKAIIARPLSKIEEIL